MEMKSIWQILYLLTVVLGVYKTPLKNKVFKIKKKKKGFKVGHLSGILCDSYITDVVDP